MEDNLDPPELENPNIESTGESIVDRVKHIIHDVEEKIISDDRPRHEHGRNDQENGCFFKITHIIYFLPDASDFFSRTMENSMFELFT